MSADVQPLHDRIDDAHEEPQEADREEAALADGKGGAGAGEVSIRVPPSLGQTLADVDREDRSKHPDSAPRTPTTSSRSDG